MGGTITAPSDKQIISDLKNERDSFKRALEEIVRANGQKSRKIAIDKARELLYPKRDKKEESYPFWKARLDWWNHK